MTNSKTFGAINSKNSHGFVSLLTSRTTSFGSLAQISPARTFWKCLQGIKLSLVGFAYLVDIGKIWKPHFRH